jgi:hypothetical protein
LRIAEGVERIGANIMIYKENELVTEVGGAGPARGLVMAAVPAAGASSDD